jgi:hypothetical protein
LAKKYDEKWKKTQGLNKCLILGIREDTEKGCLS